MMVIIRKYRDGKIMPAIHDVHGIEQIWMVGQRFNARIAPSPGLPHGMNAQFKLWEVEAILTEEARTAFRNREAEERTK